MKSFRFAFFAGLCALIATPALGQYGGADSLQFVKAVQDRDGNKATQLIADHPTIIDSKDSKGDTGLIIAIRGGESDWTGFLLGKGADPNLQGAAGDTPLIAAARTGFDEAAGSRGHGLTSMRKRACAVCGGVAMRSAATGTTLSLRLPSR